MTGIYLTKLKRRWNQYKHRFVPWIALNLKNSGPYNIDPDNKLSPAPAPVAATSVSVTSPKISHITKCQDQLITDKEVKHFLCKFLPQLNSSNGKYSNQVEIYKKNKLIMKKYVGFTVSTGQSKIAGTGVFVESGRIKAGSIVALYPGTIYQPHEPLFFQSIANQFIFRCSDNLLIDGNNRGISKSIFISCALRDQFSHVLPACDMTWLSPHPVNPLAVGQYVNDRVGTNNVAYQECFLMLPNCQSSVDPEELSPSYWKYLPNVWSNPDNNSLGLKVIPLVAVKDIEEGEELVSSYLTFIH